MKPSRASSRARASSRVANGTGDKGWMMTPIDRIVTAFIQRQTRLERRTDECIALPR